MKITLNLTKGQSAPIQHKPRQRVRRLVSRRTPKQRRMIFGHNRYYDRDIAALALSLLA